MSIVPSNDPILRRLDIAEQLLDALIEDLANGIDGDLLLLRHNERRHLLEGLYSPQRPPAGVRSPHAR